MSSSSDIKRRILELKNVGFWTNPWEPLIKLTEELFTADRGQRNKSLANAWEDIINGLELIPQEEIYKLILELLNNHTPLTYCTDFNSRHIAFEAIILTHKYGVVSPKDKIIEQRIMPLFTELSCPEIWHKNPSNIIYNIETTTLLYLLASWVKKKEQRRRIFDLIFIIIRELKKNKTNSKINIAFCSLIHALDRTIWDDTFYGLGCSEKYYQLVLQDSFVRQVLRKHAYKELRPLLKYSKKA